MSTQIRACSLPYTHVEHDYHRLHEGITHAHRCPGVGCDHARRCCPLHDIHHEPHVGCYLR